MLVPDLLEEPLRWRKPNLVFVNSMSDVYHKDVPYQFINNIFRVMKECYWHTFFIITKRPQRLLDWARNWQAEIPKNVWLGVSVENQKAADERVPLLLQLPAPLRFLCCEPLLGPLDLSRFLSGGIDWVTTGPE